MITGHPGVFNKEKGWSPEDASRGKDMLNVIKTNKVVKSELVSFNANRANFYLQNYAFEGQREITRSNVNMLASEMRNGRFCPGSQVVLCKLRWSDATILVNGYHRMWAVIESDTFQEFTVTTVECESMEQVCEIYGTFDQGRKRTAKDVMNVDEALKSLPDRSRLVAAATVILTGFRCKNVGGIHVLDRARAAASFAAEAKRFSEAVAGADHFTRDILRRGSVMSVALVTLRHQPEIAFEFWAAMARGGNPVGSVEYALERWLRNHKATGETMQRQNVLAAASAWNLKFQGKDADRIHPLKIFCLLGTPYENGVEE